MDPLAWLNPGRWVLYAAFIAALVLGYFAWADHIGDVREAKVVARYTAATAAESARNEKITADLQKRKDDALLQANARANANKAAADRLAAANVGLRNDLADQQRNLSTASSDAVRQYATTANTVFGECSAAIERLAGEAAGHATDSLMYQQAWPKSTPSEPR